MPEWAEGLLTLPFPATWQLRGRSPGASTSLPAYPGLSPNLVLALPLVLKPRGQQPIFHESQSLRPIGQGN